MGVPPPVSLTMFLVIVLYFKPEWRLSIESKERGKMMAKISSRQQEQHPMHLAFASAIVCKKRYAMKTVRARLNQAQKFRVNARYNASEASGPSTNPPI